MLTNPYYPIFLNLRDKKCVVVGGGQVARRKVNALLKHNANVEVISPELCPELNKLAEEKKITVTLRSYRAGDLHGACLVIAATDNRQANLELTREAKEKSVLVNVVDDAEISDFIVPSYLSRGDMTIAISTAGKSPALARKLRTNLERDFGVEYEALVKLIDEVRQELKRQGIKVDGDDWQEALDIDSLIRLLKKGESEKARELLVNNLKTSGK